MRSTDQDDTESDFYGDEETVSELNARVANFDAGKWLRKHKVAASKASRGPVLPLFKPHNAYAGVSYAWQLTETVEQFLKRLPPEATQATPECPWIFICNPYVPRKAKYAAQNQGSRGNEDECPEEDGTQLARLMEGGSERLHILRNFADQVRKTGRSQKWIEGEVKKEKQQAVEDVLGLAGLCKWMLFCRPGEVDEVWEIVAKATANNELGVAAKVAPNDSNREERLVCVYTADFQNKEDVIRVLRKLRELRVLDAIQGRIYYKPDAFTYLGIASGNVWGVKASLYNSIDILRAS